MHKESETIEFKKSTAELKEAVISIVAMLNKHGYGAVFFGIDDRSGKVLGMTIGRMTLKEVTQAVVDNTEPKIFPNVERRKIDDKDCVVVEAHGINTPYFAYGRAYIRVGESDKALSVHEIETRILSRKKLLWESEISERQLKDIDVQTLRDYMKRANEEGRINFKYSNAKTTLRKLRLLSGEKLLKAAEVLFCNDNSMEVQAAVFAGTDKITFLDIKKFKGNIFSLRKQAEYYIQEHIKWRADLSESRRKEIPEIPVRAFSEAIGNSLCHRDYTDPKGNEVAVFKDRVDIYNPGVFPDELTPEDFIKGDGYSILRNPLIAETMYMSADIEKWASGLKRIYDECTAVGIKVEFKRVKTGFVVSFHRPRWEEGEGLEKGDQKSAEQSAEKVRRKCGENAEKVLQVITANLFIKTHEIADQTHLSQRTVDNTILKLKNAGFLERVGPDKGGHWEVHG
ncbi:MAG: putative DNA binding domain-containing protein [Candidatus Omnitrophica bacterium]|nr:putative DNA binding domain-containing protein [Candidatus Omnitrophota bacterium]